MTTTIIRQPGFFPYLGYFKKIQSCDIFVHYDDAQYSINDWDNRNKIRTMNGSRWITVPVKKPYKKKLFEVEIAYDENWILKHKNIIKESYQNAPFFKDYWSDIEKIYDKKWNRLIDLNYEFIDYCNSILEINTKIVRSQDMKLNFTKSEKILEICKKINATTYISGEEGKNYLDEKLFLDSGIKILYEKFQYPTYKQYQKEFIPNMSIIDLIFNEGPKSKRILHDSKNITN